MKILVLGARAVAVCADRDHWLVFNATAEAARHPTLQQAAREGRIAALVLTDAQPEHAAGLAALCHPRPLDLYATPAVFEALTGSAAWLGEPVGAGPADLRWHPVAVAGDVRSVEFRIDGIAALSLRALAIDGPPGAAVGDCIALLVADRRDGQRLFFSPVLAGADALPWMQGADCVLVTGALQPGPRDWETVT